MVKDRSRISMASLFTFPVVFVPHGNLQQLSATLFKLFVCLPTLLEDFFPSKVCRVLVIRIYVYAFVALFRNTLAVYPDVECVFLFYTVPMWPMA